MVRGWLWGLVVVASLASVVSALALSGPVQVYVNGLPIASPALVQNGVVYLPVRAVSEALGVPADWNGQTRSVYVGKGSAVPAVAPEVQPASTGPVEVTQPGPAKLSDQKDAMVQAADLAEQNPAASAVTVNGGSVGADGATNKVQWRYDRQAHIFSVRVGPVSSMNGVVMEDRYYNVTDAMLADIRAYAKTEWVDASSLLLYGCRHDAYLDGKLTQSDR